MKYIFISAGLMFMIIGCSLISHSYFEIKREFSIDCIGKVKPFLKSYKDAKGITYNWARQTIFVMSCKGVIKYLYPYKMVVGTKTYYPDILWKVSLRATSTDNK